ALQRDDVAISVKSLRQMRVVAVEKFTGETPQPVGDALRRPVIDRDRPPSEYHRSYLIKSRRRPRQRPPPRPAGYSEGSNFPSRKRFRFASAWNNIPRLR